MKHAPFAIGEAETLFDGSDVTLLTYGFLVREVVKARAILDAKGVIARVVSLRTLEPDRRARHREGGARHAPPRHHRGPLRHRRPLLDRRRDARAHAQTARVSPIALEDRWFKPGRLDDVLAHEGFTGEQIASRVLAALG